MSDAAALVASARGVIFDLEGTLYRGDTVLPGAVEATQRLRASGRAIAYLTNTTSRGRGALAQKLRAMGFAAEESQILCPSAAAAAFLRARGESAWLLVPPLTCEEFAGVPVDTEHPDWIVIGDVGENWNFELMNRAFRIVHERGARLMALVRSRYWLAEDGLRLDAGPFVAALEYATGAEALSFGKPDRGIFDAALAAIGVGAAEAVMVGDDPITDVRAAAAAGLRTILVRSGKYTEGADEVSETSVRVIRPEADAIVDSVADL